MADTVFPDGDQTRQRITPSLITNLAEIKTRGDWKQVVEDHALDYEDRSARLMSNFTISRSLAYNTFILAISSTETSILAIYQWVWAMQPNKFTLSTLVAPNYSEIPEHMPTYLSAILFTLLELLCTHPSTPT